MGHYASHTPCGHGRIEFPHDLSRLPRALYDPSKVSILQGSGLPCHMMYAYWKREGVYSGISYCRECRRLVLPEAIFPRSMRETAWVEQSHHTEERSAKRWRELHMFIFDGVTKGTDPVIPEGKTLLVTRASTKSLWLEKV